MIVSIILGAIVIAYTYYRPYVDFTENNIILWYSKKGDRKYIILWSKKT